MRYLIIVLWMLVWQVPAAMAQVSIGIGLPGVNIGINLPLFPDLVQVPDYPVYYAPQMNSNYFFYDGMYWVYQGDNWYASSWYNGPWGLVTREVVPLYVLRIPVRYYRDPPGYFRGWRPDAPPRWGEHWGNDWEQRRSGWDRWDRRSAPAPAPLPVYQRQYSGDRYPHAEQQEALHRDHYRYQPREAVVRQRYQRQEVQTAPLPAERGSQERGNRQQDIPRTNPPQQQGITAVPRSLPQPRGGEEERRSTPAQAPAQQRIPAAQDQRQPPQPDAAQREPQTPRSNQADSPRARGPSQERVPGQDKDREKGEERGPERNR